MPLQAVAFAALPVAVYPGSVSAPDIFLVRYDFQMVRATTQRIAAQVIDDQAVRYLPTCEFIDRSMRRGVSPMSTHATVTARSPSTGPYPTTCSLMKTKSLAYT